MRRTKVTGIAEARRNMSMLIGNIHGKKVVRAVYKALFIGGGQAAIYTPIDTSTLINSQFREVASKGMIVTGKVGYSANYAVYVHDPKVAQRFRRSTAKKEFLKLGFEDPIDQIDKAVADEMKL
ncbi:HK97 gp10 family phage protein [Serratia fonticola]|uniref:HK97 gp10 family phage protein n=2 Tax=Serratia fonticola TaxID=47917 RepID=UPI003AAD7AAA|nr:HK97 gp10 family phage protein [Serratia fonticola]HBE9089577.1 HK97 gp10 family phage protein [Serratia fonticola]HBE9152296.1 HK97 gp10 family phage protein [Serratia fonticola]